MMGFYDGSKDGKHYWLTPNDLYNSLDEEFDFDFDSCPYPRPDNFDGLTCEWGNASYVNPPFGTIIHQGKKKGVTAWVRKAIEENRKGKTVVLVFPLPKWVHYLLDEKAELKSLGDVRWLSIEDKAPGKGIGQYIMQFTLKGKK